MQSYIQNGFATSHLMQDVIDGSLTIIHVGAILLTWTYSVLCRVKPPVVSARGLQNPSIVSQKHYLHPNTTKPPTIPFISSQSFNAIVNVFLIKLPGYHHQIICSKEITYLFLSRNKLLRLSLSPTRPLFCLHVQSKSPTIYDPTSM